jgi:hypothetical protein
MTISYLASQMLLFLLHVAIPPLGSHPKTRARYIQSINFETNTLSCFDNSTVIPLIDFNNGFLDCPDGSDEPSTGADPNSTFYCANGGILPLKIKGWNVGDGICDCCDGSDEANNAHASCPNTCGVFAARRDKLISVISARYAAARSARDNLMQRGEKLLTKSRRRMPYLAIPVSAVDWLFTALGAPTGPHAIEYDFPDWAKSIGTLWKYTFWLRGPREEFAEVFCRAMIADLRRVAHRLFDRLTRRKLVEAGGNMTEAAAPLFGEKFRQGSFVLKFMKKVTQHGVLLGRFVNVTGGVMHFENGDSCWEAGQPNRFSLELVCDEKNEFRAVVEAETCSYQGIFATPVVCRETEGEGIEKVKLKRLEKIAKVLNIPE